MLPVANPPTLETTGTQSQTIPREVVKARRVLQSLANDISLISETTVTFCVDGTTAEDNAEILGMLDSIESIYSKYCELFDNTIDVAETLDANVAFPTEYDEHNFRQVKSLYYQARGTKVRLHSRISIRVSLNSFTSPSLSTGGSQTILPKIKIKTFSGEFSDWPTFHQLFSALVINDRNLTDAERFHYLLSFVDGRALDAIKHIKVIDTNFTQAWDALIRVFDDKRRLANTYLDNLLSFKPASGRPTADSLQQYLSQVSESVTSLKNVDIPDLSEFLLCELALKVLDPVTREAFELQWVQVGSTFPDFNTLKQFVENRCNVLRMTSGTHIKLNPQRSYSAPQTSKSFKSPNRFGSKLGQALLVHTPKPDKTSHHDPSTKRTDLKFECFICKQAHRILQCPQYSKMDPVKRLDALKLYPGCRSCLHPSHKTLDCPSEFTCKFCNKRHRSSLHLASNVEIIKPPPINSSPHTSDQPSTSNSFCGANTSNHTGVLLGTIIVNIVDSKGFSRPYRGVIDPGSQFSFLKIQTCKELNLPTKPHKGTISGVDQVNLPNIKGRVNLEISSAFGSHSLHTKAVVVPSITPPLPQDTIDSPMWADYKLYDLSDPQFTEPGPIHFLLGADLFPDIVTGIPIVINGNGPCLLRTIFGYTVIGRYSTACQNTDNSVSLLAHADPLFRMEKFWETEEPIVESVTSPADLECENNFFKTHYRTPKGRYVVSLPFSSSESVIEPNYIGALNRFHTLEAKLARNPDLQKEYIKFMKEYEDFGHMSVANCEPKFIIPHHPVFRTSGDERKLRVVFDGSFKSKSGALNSHLHKGPKLQADVSNILLNLRRWRYALSCDIVKMFRQVLIHPDHRPYQQIFWRYSSNEPVTLYNLNTVTYGTRPAPWLSMRAVRALIDDDGQPYPQASNALLNHIYVDDVIDGRDTVEELELLKRELTQLLKKGGFHLSKWASNHAPIITDCTANPSVSLCKDENLITKILGMHWNPRTDNFTYVVSPPVEGNSKRIILSTIARLFDPLGYLAPVIFFAKCIMQETWRHNLHWDDDVPHHLSSQWQSFTNELIYLSKITIPRALPKSTKSHQLLCFSDASEKGYCAAAYLCTTQGSDVTVSLIKTKTRLTPLKPSTIPRLELCGALLLADLFVSLAHFREAMQINEVYCFTDSMIVLAWLRTDPHLLQTYVAGRVQKILAIHVVASHQRLQQPSRCWVTRDNSGIFSTPSSLVDGPGVGLLQCN